MGKIYEHDRKDEEEGLNKSKLCGNKKYYKGDYKGNQTKQGVRNQLCKQKNHGIGRLNLDKICASAIP